MGKCNSVTQTKHLKEMSTVLKIFSKLTKYKGNLVFVRFLQIKMSKEKMLKAESTTITPKTRKLEDVLLENNLLSKFSQFLIGKPVPKVKQLPPPFNSK